MWARQESNLGPPNYQFGALTTEPRAHQFIKSNRF